MFIHTLSCQVLMKQTHLLIIRSFLFGHHQLPERDSPCDLFTVTGLKVQIAPQTHSCCALCTVYVWQRQVINNPVVLHILCDVDVVRHSKPVIFNALVRVPSYDLTPGTNLVLWNVSFANPTHHTSPSSQFSPPQQSSPTPSYPSFTPSPPSPHLPP